MRIQSVIGVLVGALATAALAQVASPPIEEKGGNVAVDEATPAWNRSSVSDASSNTTHPRDEAVPALPGNRTVPIEPKR